MGCTSSTEDHRTSSKSPNNGSAGDQMPDNGLDAEFEYVRVLGSGGSADTSLYRERATGELVAIKLIRRPVPVILHHHLLQEITSSQHAVERLLLQDTGIYRFIDKPIQAELGEGNVNVVASRELLLTADHLALVLEYAAGGNLSTYVTSKQPRGQVTEMLYLSEDEARYYFRQFIRAVAYCHAHQVAHRDLKLDNTLLDGSVPARIKLCDFGFAKEWSSDDSINMMTMIGTPVYMAPEQLQTTAAYLGTAVDVWASGIMLLVMMDSAHRMCDPCRGAQLGTFPFDHTTHRDANTTEAHQELWTAQMEHSWSSVPHISAIVGLLSTECRHLMDRIFEVDEAKRITIPEIQEHPWYTALLSPSYQAAEAQIGREQALLESRLEVKHMDVRRKATRCKAVEELITEAERPGGDFKSIERRVSLTQTDVNKWTRPSLEGLREDKSFHYSPLASRGGRQ